MKVNFHVMSRPPPGVGHSGRIRMEQPRQPSSKTKVFEGLNLVEWFLNNDRLDEAKQLMARIEAGEVMA